MSVGFQWLFLTVPLVGLQCVLVFFPDHNSLIFGSKTWSMVLIFSTSVYIFTEKDVFNLAQTLIMSVNLVLIESD